MILLKNKQFNFIDLLNLWLSTKENIKIQSYQKYENIINNYLKNDIGKTNIKKLTNNIIIKYIDSLEKDNVSFSVQKTILYIIKSSIRYGIKYRYCKNIELDNIKIKKNIKKIEILSKKDQIVLEEYLKNNINIRKLCVLICLYTGLRIGEVCGLKWEDIDFDNKTLEVKRTIQRIKNTTNNTNNKTILIESSPKSITSRRIVPIADFLIDLLKEFKSCDSYYLLSNSEKIYDSRLLESFYKRVLKSCGIKYNNFHILRHTFATRAIESQMDIKTLSEILGHSSIEITLKLYVHPSYELKKNSIENLVSYMNNKLFIK